MRFLIFTAFFTLLVLSVRAQEDNSRIELFEKIEELLPYSTLYQNQTAEGIRDPRLRIIPVDDTFCRLSMISGNQNNISILDFDILDINIGIETNSLFFDCTDDLNCFDVSNQILDEKLSVTRFMLKSIELNGSNEVISELKELFEGLQASCTEKNAPSGNTILSGDIRFTTFWGEEIPILH